MHRYCDLPTVFHLTHWKAGSQWIFQVLSACAPDRIIHPEPLSNDLLRQPIVKGHIYPTLYVTRDEFEAVTIPDPHFKFLVIRDLRDVLISVYFADKHSHVPLYLPEPHQSRAKVGVLPLAEGLQYLMHMWLPRVARIQTSWVKSGVLLVHYEELLQDEVGQFERLLNYCQLQVSPGQLRRIVAQYSFERMSGRPKGVEDITSHHRKAVAGDWRNYLTGELLDEFKELYDETLIETGYEANRDWGLSQIPKTYTYINPVKRAISRISQRPGHDAPRKCWCSSGQLAPFSPDYDKCVACASLVCRVAVTLDDLLVSDDAIDLYGREYWLSPWFYAHNGGDIHERARFDLSDLHLTWLLTLLKYKAPGARVLEVGCGSGAFVALMRWAGFEAVGLELSPWVVEFARNTFDVPIYCGPVERQDFAPGSFDVIVLLNVLEHLPDPMSTLTLCMRLLAPDGMLLIETPCFNDQRPFEAMRASGARFLSELRPVEHIHLFTERALRLLLERVGCHWTQQVQQLLLEQQMYPYKLNQFLIAGPYPLPERPAAPLGEALSASSHGRMLQGLLDLNHYWQRTLMRLSEIRTGSTMRLIQTRSTLSSLSTQDDAIATGQGWYPIEYYNREIFRWVANDAELIIHTPTGSRRTLSLEIEPGPGVGLQPFTLHVLDEKGNIAATAQVKGREVVNVTLPIERGRSVVFTLHVEGGGRPAPNDPRILNFRVFRFGWSDCEPRDERALEAEKLTIQSRADDTSDWLLKSQIQRTIELECELEQKEKVIRELHTEAERRREKLEELDRAIQQERARWAHEQQALSEKLQALQAQCDAPLDTPLQVFRRAWLHWASKRRDARQ